MHRYHKLLIIVGLFSLVKGETKEPNYKIDDTILLWYPIRVRLNMIQPKLNHGKLPQLFPSAFARHLYGLQNLPGAGEEKQAKVNDEKSSEKCKQKFSKPKGHSYALHQLLPSRETPHYSSNITYPIFENDAVINHHRRIIHVGDAANLLQADSSTTSNIEDLLTNRSVDSENSNTDNIVVTSNDESSKNSNNSKIPTIEITVLGENSGSPPNKKTEDENLKNTEENVATRLFNIFSSPPDDAITERNFDEDVLNKDVKFLENPAVNKEISLIINNNTAFPNDSLNIRILEENNSLNKSEHNLEIPIIDQRLENTEDDTQKSEGETEEDIAKNEEETEKDIEKNEQTEEDIKKNKEAIDEDTKQIEEEMEEVIEKIEEETEDDNTENVEEKGIMKNKERSEENEEEMEVGTEKNEEETEEAIEENEKGTEEDIKKNEDETEENMKENGEEIETDIEKNEEETEEDTKHNEEETDDSEKTEATVNGGDNDSSENLDILALRISPVTEANAPTGIVMYDGISEEKLNTNADDNEAFSTEQLPFVKKVEQIADYIASDDPFRVLHSKDGKENLGTANTNFTPSALIKPHLKDIGTNKESPVSLVDDAELEQLTNVSKNNTCKCLYLTLKALLKELLEQKPNSKESDAIHLLQTIIPAASQPGAESKSNEQYER